MRFAHFILLQQINNQFINLKETLENRKNKKRG